ncbi:uncharacterized protein LOC124837388 [Vigna umbellata]|uniref:uncharacterized protein LOC124837382 n=1 Tax=Vigna umbellata TaxID=87088 RepID=UPI001F5F0A61|nr:uncharacterized protein LOC124837382 [Vigna umbellata]XP_047168679.1 uncharacterized protein LOC124837383 [Vigna umbellata]XP_047168680.1 uncharacterized protein LOC124837384 [Vigna umbellata]XP_047168687.1 uncharacterized protein LOC124837388 [Vigna umbellata]
MESSTKHFQKLQTNKTAKPRKHNRYLRKIANVLRYAEMCVVLVLVSRLSINLPSTLRNSTEYFRNFMGSPRFVFFLGNVIIITLFAQSGHFSNQASDKPSPEPDLYLEFLQNSTVKPKLIVHSNTRKTKVSVRVEDGTKGRQIDPTKTETSLETVSKDYRRCQSDIVERVVENEKPPRVLQRCETEKVIRNVDSYPEDGMSNDDFRRKIEAFIARQQRLRKQE